MDGAEIALICGISAGATALGWSAARLTLGQSLTPSSDAKAASGADNNTAKSIQNSASDRLFAAVIRFPSLPLMRKSKGDVAADQALFEWSQALNDSFKELTVQRMGSDSFECVFKAEAPYGAISKMQLMLDHLTVQARDDHHQAKTKPLAGIVEVERLPAAHSAFDLATDAIELDKTRQINFAGGYDVNAKRKSARVLAEELRSALNADQVTLSYQPKLDVRNQSFNTAEALFRWDGPQSRTQSIGEIIICAEKYGVIQDLTLWTLQRAVSDQLQLLDHGIDLVTFVNLSGALISDSEFTLKAIEIIKGASGKIGIEITETSVIDHASDALCNLDMYAAAGAKIAIDDYGTGLSSLRYLKRIPAQELKIDREFIKDLTRSHRDPMIVRSTIDLAHALGLKVTAEGVDNPTKLALLKVMGCDELQGFHIAKPMSLPALITFLNEQNSHLSALNTDTSLLPKRSEIAAG